MSDEQKLTDSEIAELRANHKERDHEMAIENFCTNWLCGPSQWSPGRQRQPGGELLKWLATKSHMIVEFMNRTRGRGELRAGWRRSYVQGWDLAEMPDGTKSPPCITRGHLGCQDQRGPGACSEHAWCMGSHREIDYLGAVIRRKLVTDDNHRNPAPHWMTQVKWFDARPGRLVVGMAFEMGPRGLLISPTVSAGAGRQTDRRQGDRL